MATKGKGKEKVKPSSSQADTRQTPTEKEVIPGKLSEKAWLKVVERAEGTLIASEVINEIFEVSFSIVNSHYLEKQAFPHAITDAKQSLLKIIEWEFLVRDEGESDTVSDPSWIEDDEPLPAPIDSWARGMVPSNTLSALSFGIETIAPIRVHSQLPRESPAQRVLDSPGTDTRTSTVESTRLPKKKVAGSRNRPMARHTKPRLVPINKPLEPIEEPNPSSPDIIETASVRSHTPDSYTSEPPTVQQLPYGMKPIQLTWQKEVLYDERGKIIDMLKLDPSKFPNHSVRPAVTIAKMPTPQAQVKSKKVDKSKGKFRGYELSKRGSDGRTRTQPRAGESRRFPELPALPSLIDTIDPVAGVTVREAGRTRQGPIHHKLLTNTHNTNLNPLKLNTTDKEGKVYS